MIKNFLDAFTYVNKWYTFTEENYPVMTNLTEIQKRVFALKHVLLHMLKSNNKLMMTTVEEKGAFSLGSLSQPDENFAHPAVLEYKKATLKQVVNILKACELVHMDTEEIKSLVVPSRERFLTLIPLAKNSTASFKGSIEWYIEKMVIVLEKADHEDIIDISEVFRLITTLYQAMLYWFDESWVPDFLGQIPDVMKSK